MAFIPYLYFDGTAREAFEFYAHVFGAPTDSLMTYGDAPGDWTKPEDAERVLHSWLPLPGGAELMMADRPSTASTTIGTNIALTLGFDDLDEQKKIFAALSEAGTVLMPLGKSFFAESYGMVRDRFSIEWQLTYNLLPGTTPA